MTANIHTRHAMSNWIFEYSNGFGSWRHRWRQCSGYYEIRHKIFIHCSALHSEISFLRAVCRIRIWNTLMVFRCLLHFWRFVWARAHVDEMSNDVKWCELRGKPDVQSFKDGSTDFMNEGIVFESFCFVLFCFYLVGWRHIARCGRPLDKYTHICLIGLSAWINIGDSRMCTACNSAMLWPNTVCFAFSLLHSFIITFFLFSRR